VQIWLLSKAYLLGLRCWMAAGSLLDTIILYVQSTDAFRLALDWPIW
jgi:hypothetical protein